MHRFRKRSDAKRPIQLGTEVAVSVHTDPHDTLPSLPPESDFRTSLILPDLTRRFSVLRNSSGEPIGLDELKSKLAEQRARGSQNLVTEEEEDMILEALGRFHHTRSRSRRKKTGYDEGEGRGDTADAEDDDADPVRQSVQSSSSVTTPSLRLAPSNTSMSSAKGSQSSRRMSNNLFGSGKFRDQAYYLRTATPRRGVRGTGPIAQSDSNASMITVESARAEQSTSMYSENQSLRPVTPEGSTYTFSGSAPSSPGDASTYSTKDRSSRSILGDQLLDYSSSLSKRLSKALSPDGLRRASLALDQAIRELEEESDDEIVMERSPIAHVPPSVLNGSLSGLNTAVEPDSSSPAPSPSEYETGTALSSDDPVVTDESQRASPYPGSRTTSPTPRLPGYIPGMPRPMTPREATFDMEDLTPSATPRATSPRLPGTNSPMLPQSLMSSIHRSSSSASTSYQSTRPMSPATTTTPPLFFNRSVNGRYTPEERQRNGNKAPSPTSETSETSIGRRRPISPLSGPTYQPLASPPSRPTTPSNVTWNMSASPNGTPQKTQGRNGVSSHSRNGSTTSINDPLTDSLERSRVTTRSLRTPVLPDFYWDVNDNSSVATPLEHRPPSAMSGNELGSPIQVGVRSPTPTYNETRSPTSATFTDVGGTREDGRSASRRSSKQTNVTSSKTFSFGQPNALLFSPIANSSRSSLESAGSSYHTWDEDHKKDRLFGLFSSLDSHNAPWHDISPDKSGTSTAGTSPYDTTEIEDAVRREIGLTKTDYIAIQDKLIGAALTKAATPENRRPGSIRRRRPSTSQSNYSYNGERAAANSTPQPHSHQQTSATSARAATSEQMAKANALLNAVVDSIESPQKRSPKSLPAEEPSLTVPALATPEQSSPMRRNRALAEALFGTEDQDMGSSLPQISIAPDMFSSPDEDAPTQPVLPPIKPLQTPRQAPKRSDSLRHATATSPTTPLASAMPTSPGGLLSPLSPTAAHIDPAQLAFEVQRRAEAATAALRKSPSIPKMIEGNGSLPRKRISPDKISAPTLVSASTSVDAIPLRSPTAAPTPAHQPGSKIGSRFKKLRGTIRAKHTAPNGEEITPYPLDLRTQGADVQVSARSSPSLAVRTDVMPIVNSPSTNEPTRLKAPTPLLSPPASATPGLKGFMARFRKQRAPAPELTPSLVVPPRRVPVPGSAKSSASSTSSPDRPFTPTTPRSAPALQTVFRSMSPTGASFAPPTPRPANDSQPLKLPLHTDEDALKQLFDAASNLGLDQVALNDLIARSPSTSSKSTAWTKLTRATSLKNPARGRATPDSLRFPQVSDGRLSVEPYSPRPSAELKSSSGRKSQDGMQRPRPRPPPTSQAAQETASNAIVRRTIIFPSDSRISGLDFGAMMRKQSASRRRTSIGSKSSVHDRVPTPPPPHRGGGRRFSTDISPPMPQLPASLSTTSDNSLTVPRALDKSGNGTYDTFYDMYTGDTQLLSAESAAGGSSSQVHETPESGPALEVIELANGETIWSIVNGLRDTDGESFYGDRASFYSEYSMKDTENVKLFFKDHDRKSSKGSVNSFLSRKKPQATQPPPSKVTARPETKVFFSSSAQIGRLIENLSRGMDAGSFNITPGRSQVHPAHSASSSLGSEADMRWTVEERLEQMLGSMGAS